MSDDVSKNSILLRLYWMIIWIFPSLLVTKFVIEKKVGPMAFFFWAIILSSMIAAKYFDIKFFEGYTGDGKRATMKDFKNYCIFAVVIISGMAFIPQLMIRI